MIRRREFIAGLGGAVAWPLTTRAQQRGKLPTIGFLGLSDTIGAPAVFLRRLRELGWVEGRTISIEYRWTEGRAEAASEFLAEFVRLKVDVIHTIGNADALARISHTTKCIGAPNQRKLLCENDFQRFAERPDADRV